MSLACGASERASSEADSLGGQAPTGETRDALIGGFVAGEAALASTVYIDGLCTAVKVAPKRLLLAAHCVVDPATLRFLFAIGSNVSVAREPAKGYAYPKIAAIHVHPAWTKACDEFYCGASSVTARLDAADVAVIDLANELENVPVASVDTRPLADGDSVTVTGFGCTQGVLATDLRSRATLKFAETRSIPARSALHEGSPLRLTDLPRVSATYSLTSGPGASPSFAGLCPGDSGGPLYRTARDGALLVVGVNANYTLRPEAQDRVGLPMTNWHTRLDERSRHGVASWLRALGVPTVSPPPGR